MGSSLASSPREDTTVEAVRTAVFVTDGEPEDLADLVRVLVSESFGCSIVLANMPGQGEPRRRRAYLRHFIPDILPVFLRQSGKGAMVALFLTVEVESRSIIDRANLPNAFVFSDFINPGNFCAVLEIMRRRAAQQAVIVVLSATLQQHIDDEAYAAERREIARRN